MADATVSIGADLNQLRRELAKLPNLSDGAAQAMLIRVEKAVKKAEKSTKTAAKSIASNQKKAARQAAKAIDDMAEAQEKALKGVGDVAGDTESSIRAVSGVVGFVSPELEGLLNTIAEMSGAAEGLTKGTGILGGSLAGLATAAAVAGVAVGVAATVYVTAANAAEESAEATGRLGARVEETSARADAAAKNVDKMRVAWNQYKAGASVWHDQIALINGEITKTEIETRKVTAALKDQAKSGILASAQYVVALRAQIDANQEAIDKNGTLSLVNKLSFSELEALTDANQDLRISLTAATAELDARKAALQADTESAALVVEFNAEMAESNKAVAETTSAATDALRAQEEALRAAAEAAAAHSAAVEAFVRSLDDMFQATTTSLDGIREWSAEVDRMVPSDVLSDVEKLKLLLIGLDSASGRSIEAAAALADEIERVTKAIEDANATGGLDGVGKVTAGAEAVSGGASAGLRAVGQAGPIGAAVAAIIGAIDAIGKGLLDDLQDFVGRLFETIGQLPRLLGEFITQTVGAGPQLVSDMAVAFVDGLVSDFLPAMIQQAFAVENVKNLVVAIVSGIAGLLKTLTFDLPQMIWDTFDGIGEGISDWWGEIGGWSGLGQAVLDALKKAGEGIKSFFKELLGSAFGDSAERTGGKRVGAGVLTGGLSEVTRLFGDTPGPVRASMEGMTAAFAPGDIVVAAQTPEGVLNQAFAANDRAGRSASATQRGITGGETLSITEGYRAFDRLFQHNVSNGGALWALQAAAQSRTKVYG